MDFVHDRLENGRSVRVLAVVDNYSRECLLLKAGRAFTGAEVARLLEHVAGRRGYPKSMRVDNGSEFYSKAMKFLVEYGPQQGLFLCASSSIAPGVPWGASRR